MTTVASAESLPISVLPDLIVNRERVIFGRRTIRLRGDERDTSSCMYEAYWNNTLQTFKPARELYDKFSLANTSRKVLPCSSSYSPGLINSSNDTIWKYRCTRPHAI